MRINKKSIIIVVSCYVIWGIHPAYWNLLIGVNSMFILCTRIIFALAFTVALLFFTGRMDALKKILKDKMTMRYLIPSAVIITLNWGVFIWAVNAGHVLDCSLGYFISPLASFLLGVIVFKEKYTSLQLAAAVLAFTGLLISVITFGSFPYVSLFIATSFAAYGVIKKKAAADALAGIATETLITSPVMLVIAIVFLNDSIRALNITDLLLLIFGGAVTAAPLILYSRSVNDIPFNIVGFFQYISPSLQLIYGIISGERPSAPQFVSFIFIGLALIVFSIALTRAARMEKTAAYRK